MPSQQMSGTATDPADSIIFAMQTMLGAWDKNVGAGNNMSSKLAQRVATNGLANSYMAFNTNYHDTGLFGVYAVCDKGGPVSSHSLMPSLHAI